MKDVVKLFISVIPLTNEFDDSINQSITQLIDKLINRLIDYFRLIVGALIFTLFKTTQYCI